MQDQRENILKIEGQVYGRVWAGERGLADNQTQPGRKRSHCSYLDACYYVTKGFFIIINSL